MDTANDNPGEFGSAVTSLSSKKRPLRARLHTALYVICCILAPPQLPMI